MDFSGVKLSERKFALQALVILLRITTQVDDNIVHYYRERYLSLSQCVLIKSHNI